jgi:hypothetical protein
MCSGPIRLVTIGFRRFALVPVAIDFALENRYLLQKAEGECPINEFDPTMISRLPQP